MGRTAALSAVFVILLGASAAAAPLVELSDFIPDVDRTHFNGFELIPNDGSVYTGGSGPYIEDTVVVQQINGDSGNDILVTYDFWPGSQGNFTWYPNGGDNGYTMLSLVGGIDFQSVGLHYGTGDGPSTILFELLDDGLVVLSGSAPLSTGTVNYLGFSGGGFDTIRMRDTFTGGSSVTDGSFQALTIDNIELAGAPIPEPTTLALFGLGLAGLVAWRRKRRKAA